MTHSCIDPLQPHALLELAAAGARLSDAECLALAGIEDLAALTAAASTLRDLRCGRRMSWSRKVFIPLTRACRNRCGYCSFVETPRAGRRALMAPDDVLAVARAGRAAGCREALFTLGDKPELRYPSVRDELARFGHATTLSYLGAMAALVLRETGLLPHLNAGVLTRAEIDALRPVAASMGLMLESAAERLCARGGPHAGAPDKHPAVRLATIDAAGAAAVPFTSGILIGIGETRRERIEALLALRAAHERHGHLQEVIVQNLRPKPGTRLAAAPAPDHDDHRWTIAVARLVFGTALAVQAPPNLAAGALQGLIDAGIDDWGGVSPVTPDHVNPECAWPELEELARQTSQAGHLLVERLAAHPRHVLAPDTWFDAALRPQVLRHSDAEGWARGDDWTAGSDRALPDPARAAPALRIDGPVQAALRRVGRAGEPRIDDIVTLFGARGRAFDSVCRAADELRREAAGDSVGYVVNRNITYTNVCRHRCGFCAFARGRGHEALRGARYELDTAEIARRAAEAWAGGATEVCIQGGIRASYDARHYLDIVRAVKQAAPAIHVHAFSPLEIRQGARSLGLDVREFLQGLRDAGLGSLPGTAAEILDDEVRQRICPDKLTSAEWLAVVEAAHAVGIPSTATIMFGHVERPQHWATHLLQLRRLQARSGGFTEFVPLPFVAEQAPMFVDGGSRAGPTWREALLMHAVARLVLHPLVRNVQASWVKLGPQGMRRCLAAGANDYGGTLIDERISSAAGGVHGTALTPAEIEQAIATCGRSARQRDTLYRDVADERRRAASPAFLHACPVAA
jgi:FO synthase